MSRIIQSLTYVVAVISLAFSEEGAPIDTGDESALRILNAIMKKEFSEYGIKYDMALMGMIQEMNALEEAGLDSTVPLKARGIKEDVFIKVGANLKVVFHLINSGIHWTTSLGIMDIAREKGIHFDTLTEADGAAVALTSGLEAGGQKVELEVVKKALEQAKVLKKADIVPRSAYKAAGIDLATIPVDKSKYYDLIPKY